MTEAITKSLLSLTSMDGVYGAIVLVPLGEGRGVVKADAMPETRWHAQQGSFAEIAKSMDKIAISIERSPSMPEAALIDAVISPLKVRVTVYRIDDERTLVVFTQQPHQVSKSLLRSVRRVIPKLLAALAKPLLAAGSASQI